MVAPAAIVDTPETDANTDLVAVARAVADLRRGAVVIVDAGPRSLLVAAAEPAGDVQLAALRRLGTDLRLVLPAARLKGLGMAVSGPGFHSLAVEAADSAQDLHDLADPLRDDLSVATGRRVDPADATMGAAIKLAKIGRLLPAVIVAARHAQAPSWAAENLLGVPIAALQDYDLAVAGTLKRVSTARVPLEDAENARLIAYRPADGGAEHLAIVIGDPDPTTPVLVRLHSECFTGDLIGSLRCDCGPQLRGAIAEIAARGAGGVVLYLRQEGRGIGLVNKLRAYALQDRGFDTLDANEELGFDADERVYRPAAEMLKDLGMSRVRLLTNNPEKLAGLTPWGIAVVERVPHHFPANGHNAFYLRTKAQRAGHLF